MDYVRLNGTDLKVSPICLGTVNYGTDLPKTEAKAQISSFVERGGNFIDTAHVYGDWVPGLTCRSERVIGEWLRENGGRDKLVISTKGAHPDFSNMDIPRVTPEEINKDLGESLEYLNTDYIDLYFLHRDDPKVPVGEILDCLDAAQKAGKIRYYGCSNWSLGRIIDAEAYASQKGIQGFCVNQLMWSLADINFYSLPDKSFVLMDKDTYDFHVKSGMNVMAFRSIAKGFFALKAKGGDIPSDINSVYENATNRLMYEKAGFVIKQGNYSFAELALMYFMAQKQFPSIPIASFDNSIQLNEGLSSWEKPVPCELLEELAGIKMFKYV